MGQMIWIEVLSSGTKEVLARHLYQGPRFSIGRGYNNNLVLDDPSVAPTHIVVEESADGVLSVVDQQTMNGLYYDGNKKRQKVINLNDNDTIRIGETCLRFRTSGFPVPKECPVSRVSDKTGLFVLLFLMLFGAINAWVWGITYTALEPYIFLKANLTVLVGMLTWAFLWSAASRTYTGQSAFGRHFKITILLAYVLLAFVATIYASYIVSSTLPLVYAGYAMTAFLGLFVYLHLRKAGSKKNIWIGLVITAILAGFASVEYMQNKDRPEIKGIFDFAEYPSPPLVNVLPPVSNADFWARTKELRSKIDESRSEKPARDAEHKSN